MDAVASVSRKIPTPRPSLTEEREKAILFLLPGLIMSIMKLLATPQPYRHVSVACPSLSD
jgi:hypothetical protein